MRFLSWLLSFRKNKKMKPEGIGYRDLWVSNEPPENQAKIQTMPSSNKPIYRYLLNWMKSILSGVVHGWRAALSGLVSALAWLLESRAFYFFVMIACIIGVGWLADVGNQSNEHVRLGGQIALVFVALASFICMLDPRLARAA